MNERIIELAQIAQKYVDDNKYEHDIVSYHHGLAFRDKFAELIIKECGKVMESYDPDFDWATKALEKHFWSK